MSDKKKKEEYVVEPTKLCLVKKGARLLVSGLGGMGRTLKIVDKMTVDEDTGACTAWFVDGSTLCKVPHTVVMMAVPVAPPPARVVPRGAQPEVTPEAVVKPTSPPKPKRKPKRGKKGAACRR